MRDVTVRVVVDGSVDGVGAMVMDMDVVMVMDVGRRPQVAQELLGGLADEAEEQEEGECKCRGVGRGRIEREQEGEGEGRGDEGDAGEAGAGGGGGGAGEDECEGGARGEAEGDHYEETNSMGPETATLIDDAVAQLLEWQR